MKAKTKRFTGPDGTIWGVLIQAPTPSNAMILFRHPDGRSSRMDRYNWIINQGPEAQSVTSRVSPDKILDSLDEATMARLFQRSMPVSRQDPFTNAPEPTIRV